MIIILILILPLALSQSALLLNKTQQHFIPAQSNLPIQFSLNSVLQQMNFQAQINVILSISQADQSFDLITFPDQTIQNKQYQCYSRVIELGLFQKTNCSIDCELCSSTCIKKCFQKDAVCCCSQCSDFKYVINLANHTKFQNIKDKDITFIIDNSDFYHPSTKTTANVTIGYLIESQFNNKYKVITTVLGGIVGLFAFLEIVFCFVVCYKTKKCNEALRLQKQEQRKK